MELALTICRLKHSPLWTLLFPIPFPSCVRSTLNCSPLAFNLANNINFQLSTDTKDVLDFNFRELDLARFTSSNPSKRGPELGENYCKLLESLVLCNLSRITQHSLKCTLSGICEHSVIMQYHYVSSVRLACNGWMPDLPELRPKYGTSLQHT